MKDYLCKIEIDAPGESAREAAEEAYNHLFGSESRRPIVAVHDPETKGLVEIIDLSEPDPEDEPTGWMVDGPEGIPIWPEPFETLVDAMRAAAAFPLRYLKQGYYSDCNRNRIPITDLPGLISIRPL
jgi:hypothetical protein